MKRANELAKDVLILDTHIDIPYRLHKGMEPIWDRTETGDFDYERAIEGCMNGVFWAVFIPPNYQTEGGAKDLGNEMCDMIDKIVGDHPNKFSAFTHPDQIKNNSTIYVAKGIENGAALEGKLEYLHHFYNRGVRYITLTHAKDNEICDSSYDNSATWKGLSPFGKELLPVMNDLGMMIDISHVCDDTFYQALEISRTPIVASHSSCRHFTPAFRRNMTDDMIKAMAAAGGVIQITFGSGFVNDNYSRKFVQMMADQKEFEKKNGYKGTEPEAMEYRMNLRTNSGLVNAPISDVADHIDHAVNLVGIDHVGIGSDFDGLGPTLPIGLEDVSKYPNLVEELLKKNYTDEAVAKIFGKNFLRVWGEIDAAKIG